MSDNSKRGKCKVLTNPDLHLLTIVLSFFMYLSLTCDQPLDAQFIETVVVGNPGNQAKEVSTETGLTDPRFFKNGNFGSVPYAYRIGVTEVTNAQYVTFLNAVAVEDTFSLYNSQMTSDPRGGIIRSGTSGNYQYSTKESLADKPVSYTHLTLPTTPYV